MNDATLSALSLLLGGALHSFCHMCRKLPEDKRPAFYPEQGNMQIMFNFAWVMLFAVGAFMAFRISTSLSLVAGLIYFFVLPFVFQIPIARMIGFKSFTDYVKTVDKATGKK